MIQVLPVNDQLPILVNNTKLEMWAGATVVITNDILGTIVQHFLYRSDHLVGVVKDWTLPRLFMDILKKLKARKTQAEKT